MGGQKKFLLVSPHFQNRGAALAVACQQVVVVVVVVVVYLYSASRSASNALLVRKQDHDPVSNKAQSMVTI